MNSTVRFPIPDEGWPKISIITPSYNQGQYLEQTIRSVLDQQYPNLEYIIIDGGSKDDSVDIIRKYSPSLSFWVSERDSGQSEALEKGFSKATGELAAWINSDDYYEKDCLFTVARAYRETGFSFFCGTCQMIDTQGKPIRQLHTKNISYRSLIRYWKPHFCPPQPSIFFRREILEQLGGFDRSLNYAMDFALWLEASRTYRFYQTTENMSYYRVHPASKTGQGLSHFVPEWKMLIDRSLTQSNLFTRWKHRLEENAFLLRRKLSRLAYKQRIKATLKKWLFLPIG
ncbi:MAG TPA: glycosyltransferase family 2 protein [Puia sp.]|nr:glycosyltransferase family 2 protein [Puia sp.]